MKKVILTLIVLSIFSCSKEKSLLLTYPLTTLPGTTYKAYSFTGTLTGIVYYQYLHFTSGTSVDIYTADINGKVVISVVTYAYALKAYASHIDSFEVTYTNMFGKTGFTTDNTAVITYDNQTYNKVQ
jgi:hypothetical protein